MALWVFLSILYLVPLLSLALSPFRLSTSSKILRPLNSFLGTYEYIIQSPRTVLMTIALIGMAVYQALSEFEKASENLVILALLLAFNLYARQRSINISLRMAEFLRSFPKMRPETFFNQLHHQYGPFHLALNSTSARETLTPDKTNYRQMTRPRLTWAPVLPAVWDTAYLAHISLKALRYVGPEYAKEIFDVMASMWGKRLIQLFKAGFEIKNADQLTQLDDGKIIFVLNHKSLLDFALCFFALSHIHTQTGRLIKPRFITAKDHFFNNLLVYHLLGIGKLIETVDMVFIERKNQTRSKANLNQAATMLATKDIDLAIFPQGTRAQPSHDRSGKRRDAGYYTTVSRKNVSSDAAHLKKGSAYLAVDSLIALNKQAPSHLHLVFIGIQGTANVIPRGSVKVQTECDIEFNIGQTLTLPPNDAQELKKPSSSKTSLTEAEKKYLDFVEDIHRQIDWRLSHSFDAHKQLHHRFFVDLKGSFRYSADRMQLIEANLKKTGQESSVVYQILDRIYSLHVNKWKGYLSVLAQLLMEGASLDRYDDLREKVTLDMVGLKSAA